MTMSWHTMLDFEPPLVGCVVSNRDFSFKALKATRECVINIPTFDLARTVVGCGNCSGRKVDKFKKFDLTPVPGTCVHAPLLDECFANLECKVVDSKMAKRYNFFVLEVIKAWIDPTRKNPRTLHHQGRGKFMIAGRSIQLRSNKK